MPEPQFEIVDWDGRSVARTDFGWESQRTRGGVRWQDQVRPTEGPGEKPEDAVFREKIREDRIRDLGWEVVRWTWADLEEPQAVSESSTACLYPGASQVHLTYKAGIGPRNLHLLPNLRQRMARFGSGSAWWAMDRIAGMARVVVDVMPKPEILDPQGKAVTGALARLGFAGVTVRQGKRFELDVEGELTEERLAEVQRAAETLLANTVIETFNVRVEGAESPRRGGGAGSGR